MVKLVHPSDWIPIDIDFLERSADEVVHSLDNYAVIAGPGAGKTELLAQRACFLLQTGLCPYPYKILAISFKTDAAKNLKERVEKRIGDKYASRFISMTFDAFSKNLLDRFYKALPHFLQPANEDYEILLSDIQDIITDFIDRLNIPASLGNIRELYSIGALNLYKNYILNPKIDNDGFKISNAKNFAVAKWWKSCLDRKGATQLTFPMIGRLVGFLSKYNPKLIKSVQSTYKFIFMDEFQDTTGIQLDLVRILFEGSSNVLTAVGDNKQQIMKWAMALDDPFHDFENAFKAKRIQLCNNYRSSPELVQIQHRIALSIDQKTVPASSQSSKKISEDCCVIIEYPTPQDESIDIANYIEKTIEGYNLLPRDFVVLVKQKIKKYTPSIIEELARKNIKARDEAKVQDLLCEKISTILILFLRLCVTKQKGNYWLECMNFLTNLNSIDVDDEKIYSKTMKNLEAFIKATKTKLSRYPKSVTDIEFLVTDILNLIGMEKLKNFYPEYRQGDWFSKKLTEFTEAFFESIQKSKTILSALDDFEGLDSVPIMTIHKSKGLEYHSVIFVGLDDDAWWSFERQPEESRCTFFVALSRAKQRVIFTYCEERGRRRKISPLYQSLESAGVRTLVYPIETL